jgi:hypothetical protein
VDIRSRPRKLTSRGPGFSSPRSPWMNWRITLAFVSMTDCRIDFPTASSTVTEIVAVRTRMYLILFTDDFAVA